MCLMDLAIDRRVTVRRINPVTQVTIGGTIFAVLPANPARLWAYYYDAGTGAPGLVMLAVQGEVPRRQSPPDGSGNGSFLASALGMPGIFGQAIYAVYSGANDAWYEAVYDTCLDKAVQAANVSISINGG